MVTGAGSSIGRAAAVLFARAGADLVLADINVDAVEASGDIVRSGGDAMAVSTDCACAGARLRIMRSQPARSAAARSQSGGYVLGMPGGGAIVNISSNAADESIDGLALYTMSNAGMNMLTGTLAHELGP